MAKQSSEPDRVSIRNRKARHNYEIQETLEAGIVLEGSEVKSLRSGAGSIVESFAREQDGELYLVNAYIPEYKQAGNFNHDPHRPRKLLLHKREMARLFRDLSRGGMSVVPLSVYFNPRGRVKVSLGVGRGKKHHDKRASIKDRDWKREQERLLRGKR